jgi:hypothetical protein
MMGMLSWMGHTAGLGCIGIGRLIASGELIPAMGFRLNRQLIPS